MTKQKDIPAELKEMESSLCLHQWDFPCVNLASGKVRSCCRIFPRQLSEESMNALGKDAIFNDQHNKDRRLDMLKGHRHQECNGCWDLESQGAPSPRLGVPVFLEKMQKRLKISQEELIRMMLEPEKHPSILKSHHVFELEISFGNRCDLACVYCSYMYSSRIAQEEIDAGRLDREAYEKEMRANTTNFQGVFWDWFADDGIRTLEVVNIIGGEPLINDLLYENIEKMLEICETTTIRREKKILLQIITNLNAPPHYLKKFIEKLPRLAQHFQISLLASMESTGPRAEYIRYGVSWPRFVSNSEEILRTSQKYLYQFGFLSSVNAFSVTSLEDFLRFALNLTKKHGWPVYLGYNQVMHPEIMSVLNLNSSFTSHITRALDFLESEKDSLPETWSHYHNSLIQLRETFRHLTENKEKVRGLRQWIETNDEKRNSKFLDIFPEYKSYLA